VYTLPYLLSFGATVFLVILITNQRSQSAAVRPFLTWVLAAAACTLGYLFELRAPDLSGKVFWDTIQWLPIPPLVSGIAVFAFRYAGEGRRAWWVAQAAFLSTGAAVLAIVWSASFGELRKSARVEYSDAVPGLVYDFTGLDHVATAVSYTWLVVGVLRLWSARRIQRAGYRRQATLVLLGVAVPAAIALLAFTPIRILGQRDVMPLAFAIGSAFVFWGIYRHHLFDLVPIARVAVLEAIRDPVLVVDSFERIVDANRAARAFLSGQDLVGKQLGELLPSLSAADLDDETARGRMVRAHERALVASLVPVPDENGRRIARAVVLRDVTEVERLNAELERRVAERTAELLRATEDLRESEAKLRAVFNGTNTLIGLVDVNGNLVAVNRTALTLVGATAEQVLGRPFAEGPWWAHDPEERRKLERALVSARAGATQQFETTHAVPSGEPRSIDFRLTPYRDEAGNVEWLIPEGRDITQLKETERQQGALARRLEHGERLESLGRLAGGVAHDFNNLLSVIAGNAELLVAELPADSPGLELLADIQKAATSAGSLTRQLLAFSKERPQEDAALELDARLSALSELLRRLIGSGVVLDVERGAPGAWARIGGGHFEQIVINLLVNAKQAMHERGSVRIVTSVRRHELAPEDSVGPFRGAGSYVVTSVSDDGPGIEPSVRDKIFEPFFTTKEDGTGLGLATVYALTTGAGGFICLRSARGAGTTVEVHLPQVEPARAGTTRAKATLTPGLRVLLVDDNPYVRSVLAKALERLACTVTTADGAEPALHLLADDKAFDLLVSDINMPGTRGTELARLALELRPTLRVLLVSADPRQEELRPWLDERGARFLQKPIPLEALQAALAELAQPAPEEPRHPGTK
jgi:PAS domain S-box-containing protein